MCQAGRLLAEGRIRVRLAGKNPNDEFPTNDIDGRLSENGNIHRRRIECKVVLANK
jgi:hypothetical protein